MEEDVREWRREIRRLYYIVVLLWVIAILAIFSAAVMVLTQI